MLDVRCKATREEVCLYCSRISKSRRAQQFTEALLPHEWHIEITATAPGVEVYSWDKQYCTHKKNVRCSGPIGCRVSNASAHHWNSTFTERYNDFMTDYRRSFSELDIQYGNVREVKRELIHNHAIATITGAPTFATHEEKKQWEENMIESIGRLLLHHGFGEQYSIKIKWGDIAASVAYGIKYITKGSTMGLIYNEKKQKLERGGYHVFTRSQRFGRTLIEIGLQRNELFMRALATKSEKNTSKALADIVELLSQAVGAKVTDGTPNLDSTYKISYADSS